MGSSRSPKYRVQSYLRDLFQRNHLIFQGLDIAGVHGALIHTDFNPRLDVHKAFIQGVLKWKSGAMGVVTNGRVIGPLTPEETFTSDDFALLDVFCFNSYSEKVLGVFKSSKAKGMLRVFVRYILLTLDVESLA